LRVEVRFYGFVRDVIANSALSLELTAGSTLRDLLTESIRLSGERLRDRLFTNAGDLEANVQIFVGAEQSASLEEVVPNGRESSEVKIFVLSATCGG
jgi:molybdopterin converting factor small subunit